MDIIVKTAVASFPCTIPLRGATNLARLKSAIFKRTFVAKLPPTVPNDADGVHSSAAGFKNTRISAGLRSR